jgi:hypothetical protein
VFLFERVGDVLEEDQPQDYVLVLAGVHAAPQGVGHLPQLCFVSDCGAVLTRFDGFAAAALSHGYWGTEARLTKRRPTRGSIR